MTKRKIVVGVAGVIFLTSLVLFGVSIWKRETEERETLKDNQNYVYAYVTNIVGNELTYMELDESVVEPDMNNSAKEEGGRLIPQNSENITTYVPVDTVVHTNADTETTFQRLASGDRLKLLVEAAANGEEVIVEIWML